MKIFLRLWFSSHVHGSQTCWSRWKLLSKGDVWSDDKIECVWFYSARMAECIYRGVMLVILNYKRLQAHRLKQPPYPKHNRILTNFSAQRWGKWGAHGSVAMGSQRSENVCPLTWGLHWVWKVGLGCQSLLEYKLYKHKEEVAIMNRKRLFLVFHAVVILHISWKISLN